MTEASNLWYERVENAIRDLNQVLEEHRRALVEQVALRTELRLALFKAQIAHRPAVAASIEGARPSKLPFRAAAAAALVLGSASYAQAYDYVDARGFRGKAVDENNLAWEPPPGATWQAVDEPEKSTRADKD
jgi:ferric-dicitrate binding protein FerR (iron transport regulator)